ASWQEIHRIARKVNADIKIIAEFVGMVHEVLKDRPIYYPNVIGGHCLIPNTKILKTVYPSKLLEFIIESNEKRREEIKNQEIKNEIEELKQIATKYFNKKYYEKAI
ncbi:MAG: GDP-mannose dehydrogenase, partial [Thermoprotei archaeon]